MDSRTRWWVMLVVALVLTVALGAFLVGGISISRSSTPSSTTAPYLNPNFPYSSQPYTGVPTSIYPGTPPTSPITVPSTASSEPSSTTPTAPVPTTVPEPTGTAPVAPPPITSQGDDAVTFQMTPGHTGYSPDQVGPRWQKVWTKTFAATDNNPNDDPYPLIVDGDIYWLSGGNGGSLFSIKASTGTVNWQIGAGNALGPTYVDGYIVVVTISGVMTAYSAATGRRAWSTTLPGQWDFNAPAAADGMVFVGAAGSGGTLYGVDASDGRLVWTGSVANGNTSIPAISPEGIYVSYACQQTYDFDPTDGKPLWHHTTGCEGGGGATTVLAGNYLLAQDFVMGDVVMNASDGHVVRPFKSGPTPATNGNEMFVENNGTLQAETVASGLLGWSFAGDGRLDTSPIVVYNTVYEGSSSGRLYAVSAQTGAEEWSTDLGSPITGSIVEGDDYLIVPTGNTLTLFTQSP